MTRVLVAPEIRMMGITITHSPYVVVTDDETQWSLTGGRQFGDGASTKEMSHPNGARCTVSLRNESQDDAQLILRVTRMVYLNPGEQGRFLSKEPGPEDFIQSAELYSIAGELVRAWYQASFKKVRPISIILPSVKNSRS